MQDHTALGASGASSRANVWKRVLLATAGGLAAIWFLGMLISFFGNRALEQDVRRTAEAISPIKSTPLSMASLEDLQRLDAARIELAKLTKYRRAGVPLRLRWGLYSGDSLYEDFRPRYFDRFRKLLFGDTQGQMASFLRNRPTSPTSISDEDYSTAYNTLKAYLMTTLNPNRADTSFLSQFLFSKWSGPLDSAEQNRLALEQFKFYADELRIDNPFPGQDDALVQQSVEQSRRYLIAFTGATFVYRRYLAKVRQACPTCEPLNFSKKYPEAEGVVRQPKVIDAAFTKDGWKVMQGLISRNDWNADDEWVLGEGAKALTRGVNSADVRSVYEADYIREWRNYVKSASVVALGGPSDASRKLDKLTGNRSPLLELLCEVSANTAETSNEIASAFQPVNDIVKSPCYSLVAQESTTAYRNALNEFKLCVDRYQEDPSKPATQREDSYKSCKTLQMPAVQKEARIAVKSIDHEAHLDECVVSLLKLGACSPAKLVIAPVVSDAFCSSLNRLSSKYPFKADSIDEVTWDEFESFFRPGTGILSKEIATGGGGSHASLLRLAESIQKSVYPNGSLKPQYRFTVAASVPLGMKTAQLNLDGTLLKVDEPATKTGNFSWPGTTREAELRVGDAKNLSYGGPWAVFRLLGNYNWSPAGKGTFHLVSSTLNGPQGSTFRDTLEIKVEGVPLFKRGYLSQLRCTPSASKR